MCNVCAAIGEEVGKLIAEEGNFSLMPMDTAVLTQHSNGPMGSYSPPSEGEGVSHMTSDEEL